MLTTFRTSLGLGLLFFGLGTASVGCGAPAGDDALGSSASAATAQTVASIALANVGKGACSANSAGGHAFESSCTGNGGSPEYWCADFARWVWGQAGADTSGLSAAAASFHSYGTGNGTLHATPSVGDAVVFDDSAGATDHHVAIVTQVDSDGTIVTVSGDWEGHAGSEAEFSSTSHVVLNSPGYAGTVGSHPGIMGMRIDGFISPVGITGSGSSGSGSSGNASSCAVPATGQEGTCMDTSACVAQGGTSTAGRCPGAASIECCTGIGSTSGSSGSGSGSGAACRADGDCNTGSDGSGQICLQGTCVAGCNANWECPGNQACVSGSCQ